MHARDNYNDVMRLIGVGRVNPTTWIQNWKRVYEEALAYGVQEVKTLLATLDWLAVVIKHIDSEWGKRQRSEYTRLLDKSEELPTLNELARNLEVEIELDAKEKKGKGYNGSYAITEQSSSGGKSKTTGTEYACPCKLRKHWWEPTNCNSLRFAYSGDFAPNAPAHLKRRLDKKERDQILSILNKLVYSKLKEELRVKWGEPKQVSSGGGASSAKGGGDWPGSISAMAILFSPLERDPIGLYEPLAEGAQPDLVTSTASDT